MNEMKRRDGIKVEEEEPPTDKLRAGLSIYLMAFHRLSSTRQIGMALGCIPWTAVKDYADYYDFDQRQSEFLFKAISHMDAEWIKWQNEESRERAKDGGA